VGKISTLAELLSTIVTMTILMKKVFPVLIAIFVALIYLQSCSKKDSSSSMTPFKVRLTDAPSTTYDSVIIDVQGVEVTQATSTATAVALNVNSGRYDLLNYTNGRDTLIAFANLPTTMVLQIRLILGPNNYVVIGGIQYPLKTPSAQQSGLKLNVHATLIASVEYIMTLDFDAAQSIVNTGNGGYILKPVIRVVSTSVGGSIKGIASPLLALPAVAMAINAPDTFSAITDPTGQFLIKAVPAGNYTVVVEPKTPYLNDTIRNVVVTNGAITDVGTINF